MKVDRKKIKVIMARACMSSSDIARAAHMSESTTKNVIYGRNVRPCTLGKVAAALGVDVTEIMETEG